MVTVLRSGRVCALMDRYGPRRVCILGRTCPVLPLLVTLTGSMLMVVSVLVNESLSIITCRGAPLSANALRLLRIAVVKVRSTISSRFVKIKWTNVNTTIP